MARGEMGELHVRVCHSLGLAHLCHEMAARHHRYRVDRFVVLFRRARPWPEEETRSAGWSLRRGVAGSRRWLLPYPEVSGGAG
ncbi:hypothetical protein D3C72_1814240 [compost metagenome]